MPMYVDASTGDLYNAPQGGRPGDAEATPTQIQAWQSARITLALVQGECQRRIDAVVSENQKLNMLGMTGANAQAVAILGQPATADQKQTATLFVRSMQWIGAMKAACAVLVGDPDYVLDESWPVPDADLLVFAARF